MTIAAACLAVSPSVRAQEVEPPHPRFGVVEAHDAPEAASLLGVGWSRARFHWGLIQPSSADEWIEAEITAEEIAAEQAAGREVVGLLIGVPEWAGDEQGLPQGLYLSPDDPGNLWAGFVRESVNRYGSINRWIIWNEPDVWDANHPGFTWPGSVEDYVQLLRTAYLVAKEANPDAIIHLAAMSHFWDVLYGRELYFERLLDALLADPEAAVHDYYYDVATLHLYFNPATLYEVIDEYQTIQQAHGINKPIWLVETNAAPSSDPARIVAEPAFRVSLVEQAAFMPQGLVLAAAAGADRIGLYKLVDTPGDVAANPEPFGLVRSDGTLRPAFVTARVAIRQLADAERVTWSNRNLVSQAVIERSSQVTRVLWSRVPAAQQVKIPALTDRAILSDMWGNESVVTQVGGAYSLTLYGGECQQTNGDFCMIGGPPVYLTETVRMPIDLTRLTIDANRLADNLEPETSTKPRCSMLVWSFAAAATLAVALSSAILRGRALGAS